VAAESLLEAQVYDEGLLHVGDGNRMYWECRGNPDGRPVLIVHGGPGSGRSRNAHKPFDAEQFRVVLFDQRGCGDSVPNAADPTTDMGCNTTEHLLADIELLREHLGIGQWLLYGGSSWPPLCATPGDPARWGCPRTLPHLHLSVENLA
jgi:proline iminopeptidase